LSAVATTSTSTTCTYSTRASALRPLTTTYHGPDESGLGTRRVNAGALVRYDSVV
jgi:hypothetical protein